MKPSESSLIEGRFLSLWLPNVDIDELVPLRVPNVGKVLPVVFREPGDVAGFPLLAALANQENPVVIFLERPSDIVRGGAVGRSASSAGSAGTE